VRIAFLILRKNYYRLLGPVVDAALRRRHTVECWHDVSGPRTGAKGSEFPDGAPAFRTAAPSARGPSVVSYAGPADLARRWRVDAPDAVVSIDPPDPAVRIAATTRWIWLQYGADILFQSTPRGVVDADAVAVYSTYWTRRIVERFPGLGSSLGEKATVVGAPELDALDLIDPTEVRARFGLPRDRPVVLYLPFPLRSNVPTPWLVNVHRPSSRAAQGVRTLVAGPRRFWPDVVKGRRDRTIVEAMRAFCDAHGALLVMKARRKDPVPRYAERLADRMVYDASHYPPTILELLRVSSLCVHFYSTAVLEAASAGVPSLCLAPRADQLGPATYGFDFVHNSDPRGIYQAPGVAYWRALDEAFDGLAGWRLADFPLDDAARRAYVERFLGFDDRGSSGRLLDLVERVVARARVSAKAVTA